MLRVSLPPSPPPPNGLYTLPPNFHFKYFDGRVSHAAVRPGDLLGAPRHGGGEGREKYGQGPGVARVSLKAASPILCAGLIPFPASKSWAHRPMLAPAASPRRASRGAVPGSTKIHRTGPPFVVDGRAGNSKENVETFGWNLFWKKIPLGCDLGKGDFLLAAWPRDGVLEQMTRPPRF